MAATALEAAALRRAGPGMKVVECGVACSRCDPRALGMSVVSCGLAGGLREELPTGTVVVGDRVCRPDGEEFSCDRALVMQLAVAARKLGYEPVVAPVVTTGKFVAGGDRERWAQRGYAVADMESGLIAAPRVGVLRVILDTPKRELSPAWLQPARAMMNPMLWPQAFWLSRNAGACARIAATIVAFAFPA